jgi:hypothetical protein
MLKYRMPLLAVAAVALLAGSAFLFHGTSAYACSAEEATAKATEISNGLVALAGTHPEKIQDVSNRIVEISQKLQADPNASLDEACAAYDEMLAEMAE